MVLTMAASCGSIGPAQSAPEQAPVRSVMVAGNGDLDACLSTSFVKPLKSGGYLSVRAGPGVRSREIDRLRPGDAVWNCDSAGPWAGVVYRAGADLAGRGDRLRSRPQRHPPFRKGVNVTSKRDEQSIPYGQGSHSWACGLPLGRFLKG